MSELTILVTSLKENRRKVYKKLSRAPEGYLSIRKSGDYVRYLRVLIEDGRRIQLGIGKDPAMIDQLAHQPAAAAQDRLRQREKADIDFVSPRGGAQPAQ